MLTDLADALASLQSATSPALFLAAQTDLGNLGTLVSADPALASFATQIQPLVIAARSGDLNGLLANAANLFNRITGVLDQEAAEQFSASLSPVDADLQPGQGKTFTLRLTNLATDSETLDLSTANLPAGASVQVAQSAVALAPGASTSVDVTLTQTIQSSTIFTLQVTVAGSVVRHVASAVVSIRPAAADVIGVTATPQAVNPGDPVTVSAQVFNTANATRSLEARLQVLDATNTVIATSPLVPFSIDPSQRSVTVSLGQLATTGLADGLYNLQVTLLTSDGSPLPGNANQTPLLIGIPITASVSPSSSLLAPGHRR